MQSKTFNPLNCYQRIVSIEFPSPFLYEMKLREVERTQRYVETI